MTILRKDTLSLIMPGTTHVIDMGGKQAFIYYENATEAHMLLPDGRRYHGSWELGDDGYTLTPEGRALGKLLLPLDAWANAWARR